MNQETVSELRPSRSGANLVDGAALLLLFLHLTSYHAALGVLIGLGNSRLVSLVTLGLELLYLVIRGPSFVSAVRGPLGALPVTAVLVLPILFLTTQYRAGIYDADRFYYWLALFGQFSLMFCVAIVLGMRVPSRKILRWCYAALFAAAFGFLVNIVAPSFIEKILYFSGSVVVASTITSRLLAFYGHPNEAALAMVMIFVMISGRVSNPRHYWAALLACAAMILLTGSRTSLIMLVVWIALGALRRHGGLGGLARIGLAVSLLAVIITAAVPLIGQSPDSQLGSLIDRFGTSVAGVATGAVDSDASAEIRVEVLQQHFALIDVNPFLGVGFDQLATLREIGNLTEVSQVSWIQWAAEFGVLYPLAVAVLGGLLLAYLLIGLRGSPHAAARVRAIFLMILIFAYTLSLVDIFLYRATVIAIGIETGSLIRLMRTRGMPRLRMPWRGPAPQLDPQPL